ncbi:MAG: tRNA lysidine(34) synthetase TilS [Acidobacteria bacterium]|nr:tRNA lysidine(34) synthetase TilS [Acidobacteriota bacterium]
MSNSYRGRFQPFEIAVLRTIRRRRMIRTGECVLAAVSGGADSMALLHCLARLAPRNRWRLAVAHYNHCLRGAESDRDEEFVRESCSALALPFLVERGDIREMARKESANLEDQARRARYEFLRRAADRLGADKTATAHTKDDQAETFLMRLLRGSGLEGLSAIHPVVDGRIVRPFLDLSREAVMAYLCTISAPFREDASNLDRRYVRNRIRHELIPYLEADFNPRLSDALAREALLAREASEYLIGQSRTAYQAMRSALPGEVRLPVDGLMSLPPIIRKMVVRHAMRECRGSLRRISARQVDDALALCRPGGSGRRVPMPGGGAVAREFDRLVLRPLRAAPAAPFRYALPVPGECLVPEAHMTFHASLGEHRAPAPDEAGIQRACMDPAALPRELIVRSRLPGDRYGGPGHRKVKEVLCRARVPRDRRDLLPVVAAGDFVVWIPGLEPAGPYAARPGRPCIVLEARGLS